MSIDLRNYSEQKIGLVWTEADHQFLMRALAQMDDVCLQVWDQIRREERQRPKRIDELLDASSAQFEGPIE